MTGRGLLQADSDAAAQPTAAIYLRVSTKEQAERGGEARGFSIPGQRQACYRKGRGPGRLRCSRVRRPRRERHKR
jgi:hypothetical protein